MKAQGRLGDLAFCPADVHGCPVEVHPTIGPAIQGSSDVFVNSRPALRDTDPGIHAACCGPNTWKANGGSSTVMINNRRAFRKTDKTQHCGGTGLLVIGSPNVFVGDNSVSPQVATLVSAGGMPFCEECEKAKKEKLDPDDEAELPDEMLPEEISELAHEPDQVPDDGLNKLREKARAQELIAASAEDLAKQENVHPDDGLNDLRENARKTVARQFYQDYCPEMSNDAVSSHLLGIDFSKPVEVTQVPPGGSGPDGNILYRWRAPGAKGTYFTDDPNATPSQLGTSDKGMPYERGQPKPPPTAKEQVEVPFHGKSAKALKSTSAPADDSWSEPGKTTPCEGGATQLMIPEGEQPLSAKATV